MRDPRIWSHRRFWAYALLLTVLFLLAHLAGFRADTSVLAGTNSGSTLAKYGGIVYLLLYVIWVCIVPILVIAGGLLWAGGRIWGRAEDVTPDEPAVSEPS